MGLVEREHLIVSASVRRRRRRHRRFHSCGASLSVYPLVRQFLSEPEDADAKLPSRPLPLVHPLDQGGRGGDAESGEERVDLIHLFRWFAITMPRWSLLLFEMRESGTKKSVA